MQDKMTEVLAIVVILAPIITALVEAIKRAFFGENTRWIPLVSIGVGIIAGAATSYLLVEPISIMLLAGAIAGLAASGLYSTLNKTAGPIATSILNR